MNNRTKRIFSLALVFAMLICTVFAFASCGEEKDYVYVTIADGSGNLVMAHEKVELDDLTINGALAAAHDKEYNGGASAGYASADSDYGLMLTKLWGVENGGAYGYYVNNASAMSLGDALKVGDSVYAFIYRDATTYADKYAYFDVCTAEAGKGETVNLTLSYFTYDENWSLVAMAAAGATITVNGEKAEVVTDDNGKAQISFDKKGEYVVSAVSDDMILTPAVCVVTVK